MTAERPQERTAPEGRDGRLAEVGSWQLDLESGDLWWSDHVDRMLGLEGDAPKSLEVLAERLLPDDRGLIPERIDAFLKRREPYIVDLRISRPDGSVRTIHCEGQLVEGSDGGPVRLVGTAHDVTERTRAEEALREASARNQAILEAAPDGIVAIDETGRIESVNPACERMFGYTSSEMVGQNVRMLMAAPYRDLHDSYIQRYLGDGIKRIIGTGREVVGLRKDGSELPLELHVSELHMGSRRTFIGIMHDIASRKRAAESLRRERDFAERLVDTAPMIVLVLDTEGKILRINRYLEALSGYRHEEVVGKDWFETFLPPAERPETQELFRGAIGGVRTRGNINPILTRDGEEREVEWYDAPIEDADGRVVGLLSVGQDVTERKDLEAQLVQAQKMEAIGQLAGGVAHDFNNLLTSIQGSSELLLDRFAAGDPLRRAAERIAQASERGAALTQHLLAFSRRQFVQPKVLQINAVVSETSDLIGRLIGEDIEVGLELEPSLGLVRIDPVQLDQVLMNLVLNASDAMPHGGWLSIRTENVAIDGPLAGSLEIPHGIYVQLSVSDTGEGMDARTRARIFEPFYTTKAPGKGTGLGLSTVYGIVKQAGGGIDVESEPGRGSRFRIYLPRVDAPTLDPGAAEPTERTDRGSETILLVEDDRLLRELACEVLELAGYSVLTAAEPEEAERLCRANCDLIDLVVSDVVMPQMTGLELAQRLRSCNSKLRVLFMSGYTDAALADRGILEPDTEFIRKPFSNKALTTKVREILDAGSG